MEQTLHHLLRRTDKDKNTPPLLRAVQLHMERQEYDEALSCLARAVEQGETSDTHLMLMAALYRELNDNHAALALLRDLALRRPADVDVLYHLALSLLVEKQYDEALRVLEKARALAPARQDVCGDLAVVLLVTGQPAHAVQLLERICEQAPDDLERRLYLGYALSLCGRIEDAAHVAEALPCDAQTDGLKAHINALRKGQAKSKNLVIAGHNVDIARMDILPEFTAKTTSELPLSLVIPLKDELDNTKILYREILEALAPLDMPYEIIFIDDGSTDGTREVLASLAEADSRVRVICFRRNYGQTAALSAGFKMARGRVVVTLDGDLQNDPKDIPRLLAKMSEGYDLVSGWRKDRKDTLITRKIPSRIANGIINKLISGTGIQLHDFGCTLKAYKSEIIKNIHLYGEMHRFIPVFAAWLGVRVAELPVNHRPRVHGNAKYGLSRVSRVIFDLIVVRFFADFMTRPIQFFGRAAKLALKLGLASLLILLGLSLGGLLPLKADTFLILGSILTMACLQILLMGLTGEILIRHYFEAQRKDHYVIEKVLNG